MSKEHQTKIDQQGQAINGPQTNVAGDVHSPMLSGTFYGPVSIYQTIENCYPLLKDYVYDVTTTIKTATKWFVGRDFVFEWLETQLHELPCGYLRLVADAGLGKTAIAAEIARRYNALVHFVNAPQGVTRPDQCLNHLAASLIARYELDHDHLPDRAGQDANFLHTLLQEAATKRGNAPLFLVIDALDEADPVLAGRNWLLLPDNLPHGTYVLLTHRPGDYPISTNAQTPQPKPLVITWDDPRQQDDIAEHLRRQAQRPEIRCVLDDSIPPISVPQFVEALQVFAEGNFMYLDYVLADIITRGEGFDPLNLQGLPHGLPGYYNHFWQQIEQVKGQEGWADWNSLFRPVIELMGVAGEPVSVAWLAEHTGRDTLEIEERALQLWQRFLRSERRSESVRTWYVVHQSFGDFLSAKVNLSKAHQRVADWYVNTWGGWEARLPNLGMAKEHHSGYGLRHLATHLVGAECIEDLHHLLALETDNQRNAWYVAKESSDDIAGYIADMTYAWSITESVHRSTQEEITKSLILQCRYALIMTSLNSIAGNLAPLLIYALVETQKWTPDSAFNYTKRMPDWQQQVHTLKLIASLLPKHLLTEAMNILKNLFENESNRYGEKEKISAAVTELAGEMFIRFNQFEKALETIKGIGFSDNLQAQILIDLAMNFFSPDLPEEVFHNWLDALRNVDIDYAQAIVRVVELGDLERDALEKASLKVLQITKRVSRHEDQAKLLSIAMMGFPERIKKAALYEFLSVAEFLEVDVLEDVLQKIVKNLPHDLLFDLSDGLRKMQDPERQIVALIVLMSHLSDSERTDVMAEALEIVAGMGWEWERITSLTRLLPYLTPDEIPNQAQELIARVLNLQDYASIVDVDERARVMFQLIHCLPLEAKAETVQRVVDTWTRSPGWQSWKLSSWTSALTRLAVALEGTEAEEKWLSKALDYAQMIRDTDSQMTALIQLISFMPTERQSALAVETIRLFDEIETDWGRIMVTSWCASWLPESTKEQFCKSAMQAVYSLYEEWRQAIALKMLIRHFSVNLLAETLTLAKAMQDKRSRATVLVALIPAVEKSLQHEILQELVEIIPLMENDHQRYEIGMELVGISIDQGFVDKTFQVVQAVEDASKRTILWMQLIPYLPQALTDEVRAYALREALNSIKAVDDFRTSAVSSIMRNQWHRNVSLSQLIPQLTLLSPDYLYPIWCEMLHALSTSKRQDFLASFGVLVPVIQKLGGQDVLEGAYDAIRTVGKWWK